MRDDQPFEMIARTSPACKASDVVTRYESDEHTFLDRSDEPLSHQFGVGYCYATETDVDERFAIGARFCDEIQKISRRCPVEFGIIQEPANGMRVRIS
jgi:hypothetical protein